jgi:hypothetical protein
MKTPLLTASLFALLLCARPQPAPAQAAHFFAVRGGMTWPEAIKSAAEEMDKVKGRLGFSWNTKFNGRYWRSMGGDAAAYKLRARESSSEDPSSGVEDGEPVNPSEAVFDVLHNPNKYSIECATALKFILYIALIKNAGSSRFNAEAKRTPLVIGAKSYESILAKVMKRGFGRSAEDSEFPGLASDDCSDAGGKSVPCDNKAETRNDDAFAASTFKPGDGVYIVNLKTDSTAWQGENTLWVGDGKAFGYPFGLDTAPNIEKMLKVHWIRGAMLADVKGVRNGPPGFLLDYFRAEPAALAALGN